MNAQQYIISFLISDKELEKYVCYQSLENLSQISKDVKILINTSDFFNEDIYATDKTLPKVPFCLVNQNWKEK